MCSVVPDQNNHGSKREGDCRGCDSKCFKAEFSEPQWKRKDRQRLCKSCERESSHNGSKKQCKWCGDWQIEDMFEANVWRKRDPSDLVCRSCTEKRRCRGDCGELKSSSQFSDRKLGVSQCLV